MEKDSRDVEKLSAALRSQTSRMDALASTLERLSLRLAGAGEARLQKAEAEVERRRAALLPLGRMTGMAEEKALTRLEARLQALDPFAPLRRGYAMACDDGGKILRSVTQTSPGRAISVMLADGRILGTVTGVETSASDDARQS